MGFKRKEDNYGKGATPPPPSLPRGRASGSCKGPPARVLLTCWVKAACGDAGDLLGAPSELSALESQGRSLESGSRGVWARPKPSSASAMVCPAPCARAGSYSEDRKQREKKKVGNKVLVTGGSSWVPSVQLPAPPFPAEGGRRRFPYYYYHHYYFMTTHNLLRKTRVRPGGGEARISPAQAPHDKPAARQICLDFWKSQ